MTNSIWINCPTAGCSKQKLFRVEKRGDKVGIWVWCKQCGAEKWFSIDDLMKLIETDDLYYQINKSSELTRDF